MPLSVAAPDLREGGSWTPLQRVKNDILWVVASLALRGLLLLPTPALRQVGRAMGGLAHALGSGPRRLARDNVARVFPGLERARREELVRRCFATLGEALGETVASLKTAGRPALPPVSDMARAVLAEACAEGRGVIFPSAHLGPWERVAASLVASGVPLITLARESYDPRFSALYGRLRDAGGVEVIWRSSPGAAARILRALRAGRVLGAPMDLRSRVPSCDAPFLGHAAATAVGPARIALRARIPVVVGTAAPDAGGGWCVTATRIRTDDLGKSPGDMVELTRRINGELSRRILALPEAWVWMHDRWPPPEQMQL